MHLPIHAQKMVQEKHALLIAVFHSGEERGLGRPGRAKGTYPVNSVLCIIYFFYRIKCNWCKYHRK